MRTQRLCGDAFLPSRLSAFAGDIPITDFAYFAIFAGDIPSFGCGVVVRGLAGE